jgi:hypothetical protein
MLPGKQGAGAAATGYGAFRAPPGAGPRRVKALEALGAARFASSCLGASMRTGAVRPPGGDLGLVPAVRGAPAALHPRARSSGGGGGGGIHCLGSVEEK